MGFDDVEAVDVLVSRIAETDVDKLLGGEIIGLS
jgi:hypothetical protein